MHSRRLLFAGKRELRSDRQAGIVQVGAVGGAFDPPFNPSTIAAASKLAGRDQARLNQCDGAGNREPAMNFRKIRFEPEWLPAGHDGSRHQHLEAYASIVLEGRYEQAGYSGRWTVGGGDVLLQPTLDCHADRMLSRGVWVQRPPWRLEE